jgi:hypothetical protein
MTQRRPTAVLVMAILNFIYGGWGVFGSLCGGAMYYIFLNLPEPAPGQPNPFPNPMKFLAKEIPGYTAYMTVSVMVGFVMATALIIAGIGLLRLRPWARWLCILYAILLPVVQVGFISYSLLYVNPVLAKWSAEQARKLPAGTPNFGGNAFLNNLGVFVGAGVGMAYAIALLVVLFLPHVRAAFAGRGPETVKEQADYYDALPGENVQER